MLYEVCVDACEMRCCCSWARTKPQSGRSFVSSNSGTVQQAYTQTYDSCPLQRKITIPKYELLQIMLRTKSFQTSLVASTYSLFVYASSILALKEGGNLAKRRSAVLHHMSKVHQGDSCQSGQQQTHRHCTP
eukprot:6201666-Pleurochrysis_carterae.AAC.1